MRSSWEAATGMQMETVTSAPGDCLGTWPPRIKSVPEEASSSSPASFSLDACQEFGRLPRAASVKLYLPLQGRELRAPSKNLARLVIPFALLLSSLYLYFGHKTVHTVGINTTWGNPGSQPYSCRWSACSPVNLLGLSHAPVAVNSSTLELPRAGWSQSPLSNWELTCAPV